MSKHARHHSDSAIRLDREARMQASFQYRVLVRLPALTDEEADRLHNIAAMIGKSVAQVKADRQAAAKTNAGKARLKRGTR